MTEETRAEQAVKGLSRAEFIALIRAEHKTVRAFIVRHVGDRNVADDIAQDVFISAMQGREKYRGEGPAAHWLLRIARFRVIDYLRRKVRRPGALPIHTMIDRLRCEYLNQADDQQTGYLDALRGCLKLADPAQRSLISRFYYDGESAEKIGRDLGRAAGTVRMMMLRIRKSLRTCIQSKLGPEADNR